MAMPQRDETIEEIKRLDALLEYAVMHIRLRRRRQVARRSVATEPRSGRKRPSDEAEAARLHAELPPSLLRATEDKYIAWWRRCGANTMGPGPAEPL